MENEQALQLVPVEVCGETIDAGYDGTVVWVSVGRVCDVLGLASNSQVEKLKRKTWTVSMMIISAVHGSTSLPMYCISHRCLPMWLATIDASKSTAPKLKDTLARFQVEAAEVLANHFFGRVSDGFAKRVSALEEAFALLRPLPVMQRQVIGKGAAKVHVRVPLTEAARLTINSTIGVVNPRAVHSWYTTLENQVRKRLGFDRTKGQSWPSFPAYRIAELQIAVAGVLADARTLQRLAAPERKQGTIPGLDSKGIKPRKPRKK